MRPSTCLKCMCVRVGPFAKSVKDRQCTYSVRVTIVAAENQYVLNMKGVYL